jgi:hypothetical protein
MNVKGLSKVVSYVKRGQFFFRLKKKLTNEVLIRNRCYQFSQERIHLLVASTQRNNLLFY